MIGKVKLTHAGGYDPHGNTADGLVEKGSTTPAPSEPAPRAEPSEGTANSQSTTSSSRISSSGAGPAEEFEELVELFVRLLNEKPKGKDAISWNEERIHEARAALLDHERRLRERVAELEADALTPDQLDEIWSAMYLHGGRPSTNTRKALARLLHTTEPSHAR